MKCETCGDQISTLQHRLCIVCLGLHIRVYRESRTCGSDLISAGAVWPAMGRAISDAFSFKAGAAAENTVRGIRVPPGRSALQSLKQSSSRESSKVRPIRIFTPRSRTVEMG